VDVHAAAHLGMLDRVKEWVEADPACVNARGGDGQTPLHFASSVEIVDYLLDHGAEIDLRDIDHGGTAAQWSINQPDKLRRLMERRAEPDVFIACALGDLDLAKRILDADSDALKSRVGQGAFTSGDSDGGHIYVYELGYETRPLHLAGEKGNTELVDFLLQRSSPTEQFLYACWMADETMAQSLVSKHPDLVRNLPPEEMRLISDAAWAHKVDAVRVMLNVGFDVNARGACDSTPLDRAAIHGNRDLVELLLAHRASLEVVNEFGGNPFSACIWGSENFRSRNGDYPGCVERMISAGAPIPKEARGSREVREVLMRYGAAA
jgi:ankyrin repeat protein